MLAPRCNQPGRTSFTSCRHAGLYLWPRPDAIDPGAQIVKAPEGRQINQPQDGRRISGDVSNAEFTSRHIFILTKMPVEGLIFRDGAVLEPGGLLDVGLRCLPAH